MTACVPQPNDIGTADTRTMRGASIFFADVRAHGVCVVIMTFMNMQVPDPFAVQPEYWDEEDDGTINILHNTPPLATKKSRARSTTLGAWCCASPLNQPALLCRRLHTTSSTSDYPRWSIILSPEVYNK